MNNKIRGTHPFIRKYLRTDLDRIDNLLVLSFINKYIIQKKQTPWRKTIRIVQSMSYSDFLKTPYWRAISEFVKERDGYRCKECGSRLRIRAHHDTYLYHGDELRHLDSLTCLCEDCHKKNHTR